MSNHKLTYTIESFFSLKFSHNSFSNQPKTYGYTALVEVSPKLGIADDLPQLTQIQSLIASTVSRFNNCVFLNLSDPYLRYYVDPKNGDTKDEFIKKLNEQVREEEYVFLGNEVPPNTFDRSRALVVNDQCCHETVVLYLLKELEKDFLEGYKISLNVHVPSSGIYIRLEEGEPEQLSLGI